MEYNQKKAGLAILASDIADFKTGTITRERGTLQTEKRVGSPRRPRRNKVYLSFSCLHSYEDAKGMDNFF